MLTDSNGKANDKEVQGDAAAVTQRRREALRWLVRVGVKVSVAW